MSEQRTKQEWIESAAVLKAERFEVAGALFDVQPEQLLGKDEVNKRLDDYLGLDTASAVKSKAKITPVSVMETKKEGTANVD